MEVGIYGSYNSEETGPSRVTSGLASGLSKNGIDVTILALGDMEQHPRADVINIGDPNSVIGFLGAQRRANKKSKEFDIFHPLEGMIFPSDIRTIQWAHTDIDLALDSRYPGLRKDIRGTVGDILLDISNGIGSKISDKSITQSHKTASQMKRYWRKSPDNVIPLGIPEEEINSDIDTEEISILIPGRISRKKGQKEILQKREKIPYKIDIVGGIAEEDYFEEEWKDLHHGFVSRDTLTKMYREADIVMVNSIHETFGLTPLEGIANECVVIVSEDCGFATMGFAKEQNGIIVASDNEAISKVRSLDKDTIHCMKRNALSTAHNLTWKKIGKEYIKIYEDI